MPDNFKYYGLLNDTSLATYPEFKFEDFKMGCLSIRGLCFGISGFRANRLKPSQSSLKFSVNKIRFNNAIAAARYMTRALIVKAYRNIPVKRKAKKK